MSSLLRQALRDSYDAKPPQPPADFDRLIDATAATQGWAAAATVYRNYSGRFDREASFQRAMASALIYGEDRDGYRQVLTNALARAPAATNIDEQRHWIECVGLGREALSSDEIRGCEQLLSLAGSGAAWHRPVAVLLLRLGQIQAANRRLDLALAGQPSTTERAHLLMLKAICLSQAGDPREARAAFDEAETLMKDLLLGRLPKGEGFLDQGERAFLIHRSEARALIVGSASN